MPIYVYEPTIWSENEEVNDCCSFEILQSFKEEPLKFCPQCGHEVHRAVTSFQISSKFSVHSQKDLTSGDNLMNDAFSKKKDSPSARASQLAMRHVCRSGCKH